MLGLVFIKQISKTKCLFNNEWPPLGERSYNEELSREWSNTPIWVNKFTKNTRGGQGEKPILVNKFTKNKRLDYCVIGRGRMIVFNPFYMF